MNTSASKAPAALAGVVVAVAGTINLWKLRELRALTTIDLTLLALASLCACAFLAAVREPQRFLVGARPTLLLCASFIPGLALSGLGQEYAVSKSLALFILTPALILGTCIISTSTTAFRATFGAIAAIGVALSVNLMRNGIASAVGSTRIQLEDSNPIGLARMCCMGGLVLICLVNSNKWRNLALVSLTLVCLQGALLTGSRGPAISFALALIAGHVAFGAGRLRQRTGAAMGAAAIVVLALLSGLIDASRVAVRLGEQGDSSDAARTTLMADALHIWWQNPLGVGWGEFVRHMPLGDRIEAQGWSQYPHNILAEALVEGGVIALAGLVTFLWLTWKALRGADASRERQIAATVWLFTLASSMTSSDLGGNRALWMASALILGYFATPRVSSDTAAERRRRTRPERTLARDLRMSGDLKSSRLTPGGHR